MLPRRVAGWPRVFLNPGVRRGTATATAPATTPTVAPVLEAVAKTTKKPSRGLWWKLPLASTGAFAALTAGVMAIDADFLKPTQRHLINVGRALRAMKAGFIVAMDYKMNMPDSKAVGVDRIRSTVHLRSAKRLLKLCRDSGGIYVKVGQHISALEYMLPPEYTSTFAVLQDRAAQKTLEEVESVFRDDLGVSYKDIYSEFDPVPVGAASLAQVHRARLKTGEEVAVKVQHAGIKDTCWGDVWTISTIVHVVTQYFPEFKFEWLVDEFNTNLPLELNFTHEAKQSERVAANFKGSQLIHIPKVYWEFTTSRILTMEFCEGCRPTDIPALAKMGIPKAEVVRTISQIFAEMTFLHGFVHCDPHPGNILVRKSPKTGHAEIVLLDHGLYQELTDEFRLNYCRLWKALVEADVPKIKELSSSLAGCDYFELFASVMTARSWHVIEAKDMNKGYSAREFDEMKLALANLLGEITTILQNVNRQLILLLKTNDLLRSINTSLGNEVDTLVIQAQYTAVGLAQHERALNPGWSGWWQGVKTTVSVESRLLLYRAYMWCQGVWSSMFGRRSATS